MTTIKAIHIVCISLLCTTLSAQNVDLNTGNFYFTIVDYAKPGNKLLKIERVYNSKSNYIGLFGYGWSSNLETTVSVSASGELLVNEIGGGAATYYLNDEDKKSYHSTLEKNTSLVASYFSQDQGRSVSFYKKNRRVLENDFTYLINTGKVNTADQETGKVYYSETDGFEFITRLKDGFTRYTTGGTREYFNEKGKLVEIRSGSNVLFIDYDKNNVIAGVKDDTGNFLTFKYSNTNNVESISSNNETVCNYSYNKCGSIYTLNYSKDINSNIFAYSYNKACLIDKVLMNSNEIFTMLYDENTLIPISLIKKQQTSYFQFGKLNQALNNFGVLKEYDQNNKLTRELRKEYYHQKDDFGHIVIAKTITNDNGKITTVNRSFEAQGNGSFDENIKTKTTYPGGKSKSKLRIKR